MLQLFSKGPQGQCFRFGHGLISRGAIGQGTRKLNHFCQPAAVVLLFHFEIKVHASKPLPPSVHFRSLRSREDGGMDLLVEFPCNPGDQATSGAHEATGLSAATGNGASGHSPELHKQRNHGSDSTGMAFAGVELVAVLDTVALSLSSQSSCFSSRYRLRRPSATAAARSRNAPRRRRSLDANLLF